jgi:transposase-like protein
MLEFSVGDTSPERAEPSPSVTVRSRIRLPRKGSNELTRHVNAAFAREVVALGQHLSPPDARLLKQVYEAGTGLGAIAELLNLDVRTVQRRVRLLTQRVRSPEFAFVLLRAATFERDMARVADACIIRGQGMRAAAESLGLSVHTVRRLREHVLAMARGAASVGDDVKTLQSRLNSLEAAELARSPRVRSSASSRLQPTRNTGDDRWETDTHMPVKLAHDPRAESTRSDTESRIVSPMRSRRSA